MLLVVLPANIHHQLTVRNGGTALLTATCWWSTGQLGVAGLMGNGITVGTPGFKTNAMKDMEITPDDGHAVRRCCWQPALV